MKEAVESSEETTPGRSTTTDVQSDDQLQGSTDDNSPLLLLPSTTPTIISEVGCKISLGLKLVTVDWAWVKTRVLDFAIVSMGFKAS